MRNYATDFLTQTTSAPALTRLRCDGRTHVFVKTWIINGCTLRQALTCECGVEQSIEKQSDDRL